MEKLMKRFLTVVMAVVMCVPTMSVNAAGSLQTTEQVTASDSEKVVYSEENLQTYDDVLDMYYHYISTGWEDYPNTSEITTGIRLPLNKVNYLWYYYYKVTDLSEAGYQLIDINGDGVEELIVGSISSYGDELSDVYTMYNGKVVHLAASGENIWLDVGENYQIHEYGTSQHPDIFYRIENGELVACEEYGYEYDGYSDAYTFFYADECTLIDGEYCYYEFTNRKQITEEQYDEAMGGYTSLTLNFTPFSEYKKTVYIEENLKTYDDVIKMYCHYMSTEWEDYPDGYGNTMGIRIPLGKVSYLWHYSYKVSGLSNAGYQLLDINGDGVEELIVGAINATGEGILYDLYTMYNGKVVHLAASGERDRFDVGENYQIGESGSSGALSNSDTFYRIENGALVAYEEYAYDGNYYKDTPYFYADECALLVAEYGYYRYAFTNSKHITKEQYEEALDGYTSLALDFTPFSEYKANISLGDLNADTNVNASDAAMVLIAAANIGAGADSGLTPEQTTAANVNGDTYVNASDAAIILQYAAEYGAGYTGTLEDFLNEKGFAA